MPAFAVLAAAALTLAAPAAPTAPTATPATPAADPVAAALSKAQALLGGGKFAEAEQAIRALGAKAPRRPLALTLARQGRYREAAALLEADARAAGEPVDVRRPDGWWILAARWSAPPAALAAHARGQWHLESGRPADARRELTAALQAAPTLADAWYQLGWAEVRLGDQVAAEKAFRAAIAGYQPSERPLRGSAESALATLLRSRGPEGNVEALQLLRSAMAPASQGRTPSLLVAFAGTLHATGDLPGARATLAEALEVDRRGGGLPASAAGQVAGMLATQGCLPRPAGAKVGDAPRCAPEEANAAVSRGLQAAQAGQADAAVEAFRQALAVAPGHAGAELELGRALVGQEKWAEAQPPLRSALGSGGLLHPALEAVAQRLLALALVRGGSTDAEMVLLADDAAAMAASPEEIAYSQGLVGRAFAQAGNPGCALERLRVASGVQGVSEQLKGRLSELLAAVEKAVAEDPRRGRCFEHELYRPGTLAGERRRWADEHPPAKDGKGGKGVEPAPQGLVRLQVKVKTTGKVREVPKARTEAVAKLLRAGDQTRAIADHPSGAVRHEVEVREGDDGPPGWVGLQEGLMGAWKEEQPNGGQVELFLLRPGAIDGEPVFIASDFRTIERIRIINKDGSY